MALVYKKINYRIENLNECIILEYLGWTFKIILEP